MAEKQSFWREMIRDMKYEFQFPYKISYNSKEKVFEIYRGLYNCILSVNANPDPVWDDTKNFLKDPVLRAPVCDCYSRLSSKKFNSVSKVDKILMEVFNQVIALCTHATPSGESDHLHLARFIAANFPNLEKNNGETLLHCAAKLGRTDIMKILLEHGADPQSRTKSGKTAEDYLRVYDAQVLEKQIPRHTKLVQKLITETQHDKVNYLQSRLDEVLDDSFIETREHHDDGHIVTYTKKNVTIEKRFDKSNKLVHWEKCRKVDGLTEKVAEYYTSSGALESRITEVTEKGVTDSIHENYQEDIKGTGEKWDEIVHTRIDSKGKKIQEWWRYNQKGVLSDHLIQPDDNKEFYERYDEKGKYIGYAEVKNGKMHYYDASGKLEKMVVDRGDMTVVFRYGSERGLLAKLSRRQVDFKRLEEPTREKYRAALKKAKRENPPLPSTLRERLGHGSPERKRAVDRVAIAHKKIRDERKS